MKDQSREDRRSKVKIYNQVRVLRQEREVSRREMADFLGINHRTLGYIERQDYRLSLELAYRIADYFDLPLEAVFSRKPFGLMSERIYGRGGEREGQHAE